MNFLKIIQKVDAAIGSQGDVVSVEATGYQALLSEYVRNAWIMIQNLRHGEWEFLRTSVDFNVTVGKTTYTIFDMFGTSVDPVGKWKYDSILYDYTPLTHISYDKYTQIDPSTVTAQKPSYFAKNPASNVLYFNEPDMAYSVTAHYYKKPQELLINTDVPLCAEEFQYAIIYQAAADLCAYLGISELFSVNDAKAKAAIGSLMRSQNPPKKMRTRGIV